MTDRTNDAGGHDPQDVAEQLDQDVTDASPGNPDENGPFAFAPDEPVAVDEAQVTEPIVDSVAVRDAREEPEVDEASLDDLDEPPLDDLDDLDGSDEIDLQDDDDVDLGELTADPDDLGPEEAALHVIDDSRVERHS